MVSMLTNTLFQPLFSAWTRWPLWVEEATQGSPAVIVVAPIGSDCGHDYRGIWPQVNHFCLGVVGMMRLVFLGKARGRACVEESGALAGEKSGKGQEGSHGTTVGAGQLEWDGDQAIDPGLHVPQHEMFQDQDIGR